MTALRWLALHNERKCTLRDRLKWAGVGLFLLLSTTVSPASADRVTFYLPTGNPTYSGPYPYVGSAACSWNYPIGTLLELPDGWQVVCLDRGLLGWDGWVDIYAPDMQWGLRYVEGDYGLYADVIVIRWGWGE